MCRAMQAHCVVCMCFLISFANGNCIESVRIELLIAEVYATEEECKQLHKRQYGSPYKY